MLARCTLRRAKLQPCMRSFRCFFREERQCTVCHERPFRLLGRHTRSSLHFVEQMEHTAMVAHGFVLTVSYTSLPRLSTSELVLFCTPPKRPPQPLKEVAVPCLVWPNRRAETYVLGLMSRPELDSHVRRGPRGRTREQEAAEGVPGAPSHRPRSQGQVSTADCLVG